MQEQMLHFLSSYSKPRVFPFCIFQTLLFCFTMSYKFGSSLNTHFKGTLAGLTDQVLLDWPQASTRHPHSFSITKSHIQWKRGKNRKSKRKFIGQDKSSLISEEKKKNQKHVMHKHSLNISDKEQCSAGVWTMATSIAKTSNFYF